VHPCPLETCQCVASFDKIKGELTLWGTFQAPHVIRTVGSLISKIPEHKIHVIAPDIGGGFGNKAPIYPGYICAIVGSMKTGRPVKWVEDRSENLMSTTFARDYHMRGEIAATADGRVLGLRATVLADHGAFNATAKSNYAAANLGATWVSPRGVYVDVSGQKSLNAKHDLWDSIGAGQQKFSRDSYTLTGGYIHVLSGGVSISGFGGYTYGKTIFDAPPGFAQSKDIFESKGIFVGAGAGVPALRGQLSGSLAVAGMKGNQKDDAGFDIKADTTFGFSLGGAYTYKLSEALGVTADLRYQQYKYDFGTQIPGYKVTEKMTSLGVRLGYQF